MARQVDMRGKAEGWGRRFLGRCDASYWSSALPAAQQGHREDTDRYQGRFEVDTQTEPWTPTNAHSS